MMGDLEEYYTTRSSWYYSKQLIENSPSRKDGISTEIEEKTCSQYCNFIRSICLHLKLDVIPTATALMLCHRFFMHQSLSKNDWKTIGATCVFLASKLEDAPRRLDDVAKFAFKHEIQSIPNELKQKVLMEQKRELIELAERVVLKTIRFETNVNHAFRPLHEAMKSLHISHHKHIRKEAWGLVHNWMNTSLVVQHHPHYIAAGSLCIATRVHGFDLPNNWWQHFEVVPDSLSVCIRQMVEILCVKKPEYAKLLANRAPPKPVNNSQPVNKTPVSVLDSVHSREKRRKGNNAATGTGEGALEVFLSDTSISETKQEEKGEGKDTTGENAKLETSSSMEEASKQLKKENLSKGLNKINIAKIREAVRKRKISRESSNVKLDVSSDDLDNWIEKELESGVIVGLKTDNKRRKTGEKEEKREGVALDTSSEPDDSWIERELEEGIIVESNKRKCTGENSRLSKLERSNNASKEKAKSGIGLENKRWQH